MIRGSLSFCAVLVLVVVLALSYTVSASPDVDAGAQEGRYQLFTGTFSFPDISWISATKKGVIRLAPSEIPHMQYIMKVDTSTGRTWVFRPHYWTKLEHTGLAPGHWMEIADSKHPDAAP